MRAKKGNFTFINKTTKKTGYTDNYEDISRSRKIYYNDGLSGASGHVQDDHIYLTTATDGRRLNEINKYATENYVDLDDLFSAYKV